MESLQNTSCIVEPPTSAQTSPEDSTDPTVGNDNSSSIPEGMYIHIHTYILPNLAVHNMKL